jgi:hypothetical protein
MTGPDDRLDGELLSRFGAASPAADPAFTTRVLDALPRHNWMRPAIIVFAGLLGVLVAGLQLPRLVLAMDSVAGALGVVAVDTLGAQALAMGVVAVALAAVTLVLFRRDTLTL